MNIKAELCEIFDSHNIIYNTSTNYISCKSDTYRIYTIEEHELLNYSWDKVPKNYFLNISKHNETLGIQTVWIKSFEYSIERKKNTLISSILADLGIIETRYYARNCIISEIESYEAQKFLDINSFYGKRGASLTLGLRCKKSNELLMLMSFGASHYARRKWDCEVIRTATLLNTQVIGGASKIFKHFLEKYPTLKIGNSSIEINTILFYVDYDKKIGNSMEALGYKFTSYSGFGFHNYCLKDCIFGKKGDMFMRKPHKHQQVVECRKKGEVVAISNSGTKLFLYTRPTILG